MVEILGKLNIDKNVLIELIGGTFEYRDVSYNDMHDFDNFLRDYEEIMSFFS